MDHAGPPGLPLSDGTNGYGEDTGLKVIVLDRTDDEDEPDVTLDGQPAYGSRSNSDVYPIDKSAIERDLYKQEYDPTVTSFKANMTPSIHSHSRRTPAGEGRTPAGVGGSGQDDVRHQNSINASQQFIYHVTDYDSDNLTQRTSSGQVIDPNKTNPQSVRSKKHSFPKRIHRAYDPVEVVEQPSTMYAMAQIDYDRYTNQSQLSTVMEDSGQETHRTDETADQYDVYTGGKSRTFLIHPSAKISTHRVPGATSPDFKVMGPGYKFQVDRYNMIKRASILNRAEKLLDARRGHYNDSQSETSDEIRQVGDDEDDEDEDDVNEMTGPRHHALRHVRQRQFDDSTSYNSSDDVLNTMRYHPRGPVSQAARRARLTSVNARLNKQKRIRQSRRQNIPPAPVSDDDVNSSQSDVMEQPPIFRKPQKIRQRYEDSRLRDVSNDVSQKQPGEGGDGIKGRRVLFFRNGDAHFKPKQVLINQKTYANLEKLLVDLSSMVETSTGVKYIFSWPEGREIKSITEFENGKYYVCSSTSKLQKVDYGNSRESHWKGGKIDRKENFLFQHDGKVQSPLRRPRVLTIISNIYRDSREKLILNTNSQMNFEDILNDISNLVNIPNPPVRALYTERAPHQKVESYSQLIREFGDHDNFLACGEELMPLELAPKKQSVNGQVEVSRKGGRKDAKSIADRQTLDSSPTRNSEMTERGGAKMNGRIKNGKPDSIKCDINGKTREFFPPSVPDEEDDGRKPEKKLKLEWVYGFRGRDMKQNLAVLPSTGQLVYSVAAVVVLYDKKFGTQKHYMGHSEDITCLTIHPNGRFIATGQTSGKTPETGAHIRVWDGTSLSTYAVIGLGTFQQGISCLNFSERGIPGTDSTTGELLMAIDDSERHQLSVWDWQTEKMVARTTTTNEPVVAGCFYPSDESILVTYGKEHIHFWKMFWDKGRKIMRDKLSGNFEGDVPKFVTSICFSPSGDVISGDSSGSLLVWSRDNNNVFSINDILSRHSKKAHK
ncbi:echinoderm microtubule-associated protein-like CG42247, partial [Physella acuta]|uniref:echinoderm microtubule-associated protein-like CG42247 n=1 Tax=Physella acuta TaxID=109671 RepID=UPI0027DDB4D9